MRHFYLIFCLVISCFVNGQIINFPDPNFKAKLLQPNVAYDQSENYLTLDANSDGEIEVSEVQLVWNLDVSNANISDLTGISFFTGLKYLSCHHNLLTTITIDVAISLSGLNGSHNALTAISVNFDDTIEGGLDLSYNNLPSFTIESGSYFDGVNLSHNLLTNLVINGAMFESIDVSHNNLSSIQVVGNALAYSYADFSNNQFTMLDLTDFDMGYECWVHLGNNTVDRVLFGSQPGNISYSSNNTFFDVGNFSSVSSCDPDDVGHLSIQNSPNLQYVKLKNGYNHTTVTCNEGGNIFQIHALSLAIGNCPNLSFICVDELEKPNIQSRITQLGLQNQVQVNSYCSFTPGGTYYTVNGTAQFDYNADGCDSGDFHIPHQEFTITNGTQSGTIISDASGNFTINVGLGTHTITPVIQNPAGFTVSPPSLTVNFPSQSSPLTQPFCIAAAAAVHDFHITLIPVGPAVPGMDANYKIVYKNTGTVVDSGTIILNFPDNVLDFISASITPTTNSAGTLEWLFSSLMPFETRTINLTLNLNGPMETPPLNGNDILHYTTSIGETAAAQPFPDSHLLNQTVVNSFDPNDKICLEGDTLGSDFIGNYVTYKIRFENTGTYPAQNIVVKDVIDAEKFDITTLKPISGSHNFYTRISGNNVEFIFENINLPFDDANNDGYVVFKIKTNSTLVVGDTFSNTGSIYFDYNFPVVTNTTLSTIQTLGAEDFEFSDYFTVYPNPAANTLNIKMTDGINVKSIAIYNALGQLLLSVPNVQSTSIDISDLTVGNYFIKVNSDRGSGVEKFFKY